MSKLIDTAAHKALSLTTEYSTPYGAVVRDEIVMGVPRYFLERWVPVLGTGPAAVVNTLRQLDYRCHGETITISGEALAREAAVSRRYLYTCLDAPWMRAFVRVESGQKNRSDAGKIVQDANHYTVRLDDPLTPADADHLLSMLIRLADTPLDAARRALELNARDLWAPDPAKPAQRFTEPRAITARDVIQRAFPTWEAATDEQKQLFSQTAEALHRHITLVREDGKASKIIVPQYFRKVWWKRLGHNLAWSYLWLRGCVYDNPAEGVRRDTCWIPALDSLLTLIGRPREWWRRNVENAPDSGEGWLIADFFKQLETQKGRDPTHAQWVARRFFVALDIPIAPEDRTRYHDLLQHWRGEGIAPGAAPCAPAGSDSANGADSARSATAVHIGSEEVCHNSAHRADEGLPQPCTSDQAGSATAVHTGSEGVCHIQTQGSATTAHRDSKTQNSAPEFQPEPSITSKQQASQAVPFETAAAAAEKKVEIESEKNSLFEQIEEKLARAPETPLCRAAGVQTWLRDVWPEPIRPHTPVWTAAINGAISPRNLVALMLAVWADTSIKHPPRYLSWLIQRWQTLPEAPPVDAWERWRALADLSLAEWMEQGRREWIELAPQDNRALPFGLDVLVDEYRARQAAAQQDAPPNTEKILAPGIDAPAQPVPESQPEPNGLDEKPGGGPLTMLDIWRATLGQLSLQLNRAAYTSWVEGTKAVSYADGVLTLRARHSQARDLLAQHLNASIELSVSRLARIPVTIRYTADSPSSLQGDGDY